MKEKRVAKLLVLVCAMLFVAGAAQTGRTQGTFDRRMKRVFGILTSICIAICFFALQGCQTPCGSKAGAASSKAVMQALTKACGEAAANVYFRAWLLEYEIESESELDSAVCSEILEQVMRGNLSPEMMRREISATKERLLGKLDYPHLLMAFREIMHNRRRFKHDSNWGMSAQSQIQDDVTCISGVDSQLPPNVLALHADSLVCEDERLTALFQPGFKNMGFIALAEGVEETPNGAHEKYHKIIEGLWFFETVEK